MLLSYPFNVQQNHFKKVYRAKTTRTESKDSLSFRPTGEIFLRSLAFARLCENSVHGSTGLTTNGYETLQIKHLAVRPELRRRAPKEFSHSLSLGMTGLGPSPWWPLPFDLAQGGPSTIAQDGERKSNYETCMMDVGSLFCGGVTGDRAISRRLLP
jgi:hypothetical protein